MTADGGHWSQSQEEPNCVTENSSIKKKNKLYFYCQNKWASRTSQWPDVPCAFIFCHCKRFFGTDKQVRNPADCTEWVNSACAKGAHPDSKSSLFSPSSAGGTTSKRALSPSQKTGRTGDYTKKTTGGAWVSWGVKPEDRQSQRLNKSLTGNVWH